MKNFLFYLGGARCGSTWLYHQLNSRPDCEMSPIKEWFLFDEDLDSPIHPIIGDETYFDFYERQSRNPQNILLGDITPSNGGASETQLQWYKQQMGYRNFNVLPLLTLRDPIDQLVSLHIYLNRINDCELSYSTVEQLAISSVTEQNNEHCISVEEVVEKFKHYEFFYKYFVDTGDLIDSVNKHFNKIHINFYETMFTDENIKSLCNYLQLPYRPFAVDFKLWSFGKTKLSADEKMYLYETFPLLRTKYDYAVDKFGKEYIESIWWNPYK